jgi:hypothetical protein
MLPQSPQDFVTCDVRSINAELVPTIAMIYTSTDLRIQITISVREGFEIVYIDIAWKQG